MKSMTILMSVDWRTAFLRAETLRLAPLWLTLCECFNRMSQEEFLPDCGDNCYGLKEQISAEHDIVEFAFATIDTWLVASKLRIASSTTTTSDPFIPFSTKSCQTNLLASILGSSKASFCLRAFNEIFWRLIDSPISLGGIQIRSSNTNSIIQTFEARFCCKRIFKTIRTTRTWWTSFERN